MELFLFFSLRIDYFQTRFSTQLTCRLLHQGSGHMNLILYFLEIPHPDELTKDSSDSSDDEENKNG